MSKKKEIEYIIPEDGPNDALRLTIDIDSDVHLFQAPDAFIVLSHPQAMALHQSLGQLLVRHMRSWGDKPAALRVVP